MQETSPPAVKIENTPPPADTVTYKLKRPFTHMMKDIESVTVRRPTGADMRLMSRLEEDQTPWLMARVTDLSVTTFDKMDGEDWTAIALILTSFLGKSLPTTAALLPT